MSRPGLNPIFIHCSEFRAGSGHHGNGYTKAGMMGWFGWRLGVLERQWRKDSALQLSVTHIHKLTKSNYLPSVIHRQYPHAAQSAPWLQVPFLDLHAQALQPHVNFRWAEANTREHTQKRKVTVAALGGLFIPEQEQEEELWQLLRKKCRTWIIPQRHIRSHSGSM